jgi:beta-galactosidase
MSSNKLGAAIVTLLFFAGAAVAELFHEQSSVTPYSTYSNRCFSINGKPTWVFAGEIEYWRVPKELWRDRLMRVKRAGYNTVATYIPWNLHEPVQGQWHFEDNLDLDAWLAMIKELGLYCIIRVGPYICAEVDFGGFPGWLVDIPNIRIRGTNTQYLQCVDKLYEKIFPIVVKHQISKGGSITLVQIENEYYQAGGEYQQHLVNKALSLGMEVPYVWSMIVNNSSYDPGAFPDLGTKGFMTEQWMGWIAQYGPDPNKAAGYTNQTWRMLAAGTGGTSQYVAHGGTNFGYTTSPDQRTASYDYGAQIGELGQIRPVYYSIKQAGWLAGTFGPLLSNSTNGSTEVSGLPGAPLGSYVHTGTGGKAAMVMNGSGAIKITWTKKGISVPSTGSWSLQNGDCAHFLADVPITGNATLDYSATGILCLKKFGTKNFLVLYGTTGNSGGDIAFVYKTSPATAPASPWNWDATAKRASLRFTYPAKDTVNEIVLDDGAGQTINLLIVNNNMSNKTWVTDSSIVCGAEYVNENEELEFAPAGGNAFIFSSRAMQTVTQAPKAAQSAKALSTGWSWIALPEIGESYNDSSWKQSQNLQDMSAYDWENGYGWYRAKYNATSSGTSTLNISNGNGEVFIFVNGAYAGNSRTSQSITLKQGVNTISILASGPPRSKCWGQPDSLNFVPFDGTRCGLWGTATIGSSTVGPWRFRGGFEGVDESPMMGTISSASWTALLAKQWSTAAAPADNVPRLWRMDFAYTPPENGRQTWTLNGTVTSGTQGVVWINNHCLGRQITNQPGFFVPECWLKANNTLVVFTRQGGAPQGYSLQPVEYRSFAKSPFTGTIQKSKLSISNTVQQKSILKSVVISGNGLSLPQQYTGKNGSMAIYDLRGHLIGKVALKNGKPIAGSIPNGVFITKFK